mmetsp:Transcript_59040/g.97626  ORF Transcript_59040/g.97626 Transcript_59040/m.97626 type:complete len:134 (+) Transcript_59040:28-429(+)
MPSVPLVLRSNTFVSRWIGIQYHSVIFRWNCIHHRYTQWISDWSSMLDTERRALSHGYDFEHDPSPLISIQDILSEGMYFAKGVPTSSRKYSKKRNRKRMSRVGFLARVRTYNGRKILLRQRRKGRRYLGARW